MGDMADWQIENILIPDDMENIVIQREWAESNYELFRGTRQRGHW